ncbi:very short patch repair endonuclease [Mesorhizobium sp. PUT5]|uniref:very short patch repair endonuclease n=1 Tax=Mesorhizobium sp. PUT5 TaxID=3454629 RepID=UPI003FA462A7
MPDKLTSESRSRLMSRIGGKNTAPELTVRKALHAAGYRFRLHRRDLPGTPDIVLPRYRSAIFVHGCFWHGHDCPRGRLPVTRTEFWETKIRGNQARDARNKKALEARGWQVLTIWTCELKASRDFMSDIVSALHQVAAAKD